MVREESYTWDWKWDETGKEMEDGMRCVVRQDGIRVRLEYGLGCHGQYGVVWCRMGSNVRIR